jgi:hypothetical protein
MGAEQNSGLSGHISDSRIPQSTPSAPNYAPIIYFRFMQTVDFQAEPSWTRKFDSSSLIGSVTSSLGVVPHHGRLFIGSRPVNDMSRTGSSSVHVAQVTGASRQSTQSAASHLLLVMSDTACHKHATNTFLPRQLVPIKRRGSKHTKFQKTKPKTSLRGPKKPHLRLIAPCFHSSTELLEPTGFTFHTC